MHTNSEQLLLPYQAAEYLGVSEQTLAEWRCVGRYNLPYVLVGRRVRYRRSDLDAWLRSRTRGAKNETRPAAA